jgi:hypothetical protein
MRPGEQLESEPIHSTGSLINFLLMWYLLTAHTLSTGYWYKLNSDDEIFIKTNTFSLMNKKKLATQFVGAND